MLHRYHHVIQSVQTWFFEHVLEWTRFGTRFGTRLPGYSQLPSQFACCELRRIRSEIHTLLTRSELSGANLVPNLVPNLVLICECFEVRTKLKYAGKLGLDVRYPLFSQPVGNPSLLNPRFSLARRSAAKTARIRSQYFLIRACHGEARRAETGPFAVLFFFPLSGIAAVLR